jgi:hypothetical protein
MGGTGILNYSAKYRSRVGAAVGVVPVCDLNALYTAPGHKGVYTPYIAAAWGIRPTQSLPLAANTLNTALKLIGLPYQIWYAPDDDAVPLSTVLSLVNVLGLGTTKHSVGYVGHTQKAIGLVDVPTVVEHLERHLV